MIGALPLPPIAATTATRILKEADTGLGREIQKQTGAPSVVVNRMVREAARKRLESDDSEGKKPN